MKKQIFLFAVAALALASCSSENDVVQSPAAQQTTADDGAVNFDVYVMRGLTRGGVNGPVTTEKLKSYSDPHCVAGFGVFGYYTDGEPYSAITKPNFFYNQQVKYESDKWTYEPIKYWPNEFGGDAKSDQVDRLTLFAYLPYVEVDPLTGVVKPNGSPASPETDPTTNITGMTRNTATGDPFIKYSATMDPANSVDLCYGVAAATFTSSNSAINQNNIEKGKPYVDVVKPGTDDNSKIKFDFKHATAQMRVTIDAVVDNKTTGGDDINQAETRIWVRSVTFTGITQKGSLNLHSDAYEGPEWYDVNGNSKITTGSLTVFDGRKDDKEANDKASNESPATLNTQIVQAKQYKLNETTGAIEEPTETGVVKTRYNLFNGNLNDPVFVIPTKEKMRVTIVYDVETVDKNLPYYLSDGKTPGSTIQNTIYKDIETFGEITAGYCYTLNLHLGMRTVDFDAEVTPWQEKGADVDLPSNMQTFAIGTDPNPKLTLPADLTTYQFAVSGLTVNSTPDLEFILDGDDITTKASATPANGSGISIVTVTGITANSAVTKKTGSWEITDGSVTTNKVTVDVTQQAAPLNMAVSNITNFKVNLVKESSSTWAQAIPDATDQDKFMVWRNGKLMVVEVSTTQPTADNVVSYDASGDNVVLYFKNKLVAGDIVSVWVEPGDAKEESVTANIAGISYAPGARDLIYKVAAQNAYPFTYYGPANPEIKYTSDNTAVATVGDDGKVTTQESGSNVTITAEVKGSFVTAAKAEGWYFTTDSKKGEYTLNVAKQDVKVEFASESPIISSKKKDSGTVYVTNLATAKSALENTDLTVAYEVTGTDATKFTVGAADGKLTSTADLTADTEYTLTVKAKYAGDTKYNYGEKTYTITFTAVE